MNTIELKKLLCQEIKTYNGFFQEQKVLVCDTETIKGKPYTIQFYDGVNSTLEYVNEHTIFDCYLDYVQSHFDKNLSVWFFYCQFDLPIIHYPYKNSFTFDTHTMQYGPWNFEYVTGKTWYGNHSMNGKQWVERDAFQYVFRGLEKIAKDLKFDLQKKPRPSFLGERVWQDEREKKIFEEYAIADVLVLWELVYWILSIHRQYDVGLSVSLADLCGKIFRKSFVTSPIQATPIPVTIAALSSYHGGKTQLYVKGPCIVQNIFEYDITSAYPHAMSQIGNFFDYEILPHKKPRVIENNGVYKINAVINCPYQPVFTEEFIKSDVLRETWVTGYELNSCLKRQCITYEVLDGYYMNSGQQEKNGLSEYVWHFFEKKQRADREKNISERLIAKLSLNALYGKFIAKVSEDTDIGEKWRGGVLFHPLIATLITGFVRAYIHDIEHVSQSLHTSTDAVISTTKDLTSLFPGIQGLGSLEKKFAGDVLLIRPKVYIIFDKLELSCYHKFDLDSNNQVFCIYCHAKVLKSATHGFYGNVQTLLNMWRGNQTNYMVNRMVRLKEAKRSRDPELLPFVFRNQRRTLNVDWNKLIIHKGV